MSIHECHRDCRETSSTLPSPSQLQVNMLSLESMATKKSTAVSCEGSSVVFESKPRRRVSKCRSDRRTTLAYFHIWSFIICRVLFLTSNLLIYSFSSNSVSNLQLCTLAPIICNRTYNCNIYLNATYNDQNEMIFFCNTKK